MSGQLPSFPTTNHGDGRLAYFKALGNLGIGYRFWQHTNRLYLMIGQFCMTMMFSKCMAMLHNRVAVVVAARARLQVEWIHTKSVIAYMHDHQTCRDGSFDPFVGIPMSASLFERSRKREDAITADSGTRPFPTPRIPFLIVSIEHILKCQWRKLIQRIVPDRFVIVLLAQFSSIGWRSTQDAGKWSSRLITHILKLTQLPWTKQHAV